MRTDSCHKREEFKEELSICKGKSIFVLVLYCNFEAFEFRLWKISIKYMYILLYTCNIYFQYRILSFNWRTSNRDPIHGKYFCLGKLCGHYFKPQKQIIWNKQIQFVRLHRRLNESSLLYIYCVMNLYLHKYLFYQLYLLHLCWYWMLNPR